MAAADIHQSVGSNQNATNTLALTTNNQNNNNINTNSSNSPGADVNSFVARLLSLNSQQLHCLHSDAHLMRHMAETQMLVESRLEALNKFAMGGHHPAANQQLMLLAQHASHQHQLQQQHHAAAAAAIAIANQNNTLINYTDYHQQLHNQQQHQLNHLQQQHHHHQQPYFTHYVQLPLGIAVQAASPAEQQLQQRQSNHLSPFGSQTTTSASIDQQHQNQNHQHYNHLSGYALDLSSPGATSMNQHDSPNLYADTSNNHCRNNNNNNVTSNSNTKKSRSSNKRSSAGSKKSSEQLKNSQNRDEQISNASSDDDATEEEPENDTSKAASRRRRTAKRLTSTSSSTSSTPSTCPTLSLTPPQHHHNIINNNNNNINDNVDQHHHISSPSATVSSILQNNIINNTLSLVNSNGNMNTNSIANPNANNSNNNNNGRMLIHNPNTNTNNHTSNAKRYKGEFDEPTENEIEQRLRDLSRGKENYHQVNWLSGECACVLGSKFPGSKTPGDVLSQIEAWRRLDTADRLAFKWSLDDLPQDIRLADIKRLEDLRRDASNGRADFGGASKRKPLGIRGTRQFLLILYCLWGHPGRQDAMQREGYCPHCFAKIRKANDQSTLVRVVNHFNMKHRKGANPRLSPSA